MRFLYIFTIFFGSCTTFSTLQTPQVVPKDEVGFGLSLSNSWVSGGDGTVFMPISIPSLQVRYGIGNKSDIGLLFVGLPVFGSTYIDYKYQFLSNEILGAFSIGTGFWLWPGDFSDNFFDIRNPTLISPFVGISLGNKRVYLGSRIYYYHFSYFSSTDSVRTSSSYILITPILGLTLGKGNFKFAPEINVAIPISSRQNNEIILLFTYSIGILYLPTEK
ncbi:MAG: hypothetical protein RMJ38_05180 [candidate division WOR-3 bacterium]|nr:hypothetical protein [candidate division WOR-3 bacterium]MDW8150814.1 hypothetical protein [candidate division WOR-3 bacterium]